MIISLNNRCVGALEAVAVESAVVAEAEKQLMFVSLKPHETTPHTQMLHTADFETSKCDIDASMLCNRRSG